MKRRLCILITLALAVLVTATVAGCVTELTVEEMWTAAQTPGANTDIHITLSDAEGTLIYEYQTTIGEVTKDEALPGITAPDIADKLGGDGKLTYNSGYFSNGKTTRDGNNTVYSANIIQPANFLGISDATEGKLTIVVNRETKALVSTTITYTTASGNNAVVTVTPY